MQTALRPLCLCSQKLEPLVFAAFEKSGVIIQFVIGGSAGLGLLVLAFSLRLFGFLPHRGHSSTPSAMLRAVPANQRFLANRYLFPKSFDF